MRFPRGLAVVVGVVVLCAAPLEGTKVARKEFTCPLDGTKFTGLVEVETDKKRGVDSDYCQWPQGSSPLPYQIQVCPKCFYAALNDIFDTQTYEETKTKLNAALEKWRQNHPGVKTVEEVSPGQRWELTAICRIIRQDHPPLVGKMWMRAAWATRHAALSDLTEVMPDPMTAFEVLDGMEAELRDLKQPKEVTEATFRLVMAAQRAGDVKRRDTFVNKLEKMKLDEKQKTKLTELKDAFAQEAVYQTRAIAAFNQAVEKEMVPAEEVHVYLYRVADATRRLGKNDEAVKLFRKVKTAGKVRQDIGRLCDFMINWLTGE